MIPMKRLVHDHMLVLDTSTDCSHCVPVDNPEKVLFTFNSSCDGYAPDGKYIARVRLRKDGWIVEHDFPFTLPAFSDHNEAIFQAEAAFLKAWLAHTAALEAAAAC